MKKSSAGKSITGILFGLVFAGVGPGFLFFNIVPTLYDWQRMQSWQPVMAHLLDARLVVDTSSDGTTYRATARYGYRVDGHAYVGDRVTINTGADNIGSFQQDLGRQLESALRAGRPLQIWVDTDAPGNAVINRELRWGLLGFKLVFALAFTGIGLGVLFYSARAGKVKAWDDPEFAGRPWLAERRWRNENIPSEAKKGTRILWAMTILWNLISTPLLFVVPRELAKGNDLILAALLFPLIGAGLLISAVIQSLRWRRFGPTPFVMRTFPGRLGEDVTGTIDINLPFHPNTEFTVTLACIYSYISGSGKNRSRNEHVLWQDEKTVKAAVGMNGTRVTIDFSLPPDQPISEQESESYHKWVLSMDSKLAGPDYSRQFVIPVFAGEAQTRLPGSEDETPATVEPAYARLSTAAAASIESRLGMVRESTGLRWTYPAWRSPGTSIFLFIFGSLFAGSAWFIATATIHDFGRETMFDTAIGIFSNATGLLMTAVFALVGGGMMLAAVYVVANSLSLELSSEALISQRRLFGISLGTHRILTGNITAIDKKIAGSSSRGSRHQVSYEIFAKTAGGKKYTLAENISSASDADQVVGYFREKTGLD